MEHEESTGTQFRAILPCPDPAEGSLRLHAYFCNISFRIVIALLVGFHTFRSNFSENKCYVSSAAHFS
jgi:hypothetical protein